MSFHNFISSLFVRIYRCYEPGYQKLLRDEKLILFQNLRNDREVPLILEIGAGPGTNFVYYPTPCNVILVEPNIQFKECCIAALQKFPGINLLAYYDVGVENLGNVVTPDSIDIVLGTMVGCAVPDAGKYYEIVLNVLKPGGKFYFMEHILGEPDSWQARWQRGTQWAWKPFGCGCRIDRDLDKEIDKAGFAFVEKKIFYLKLKRSSWYMPLCGCNMVARNVRGVATKSTAA
ncbi:methyltransferase-like protein 7A [Folsomia candida]|nr:methyltransferase-like protein 7A [Folsomia candida]